MSRYSIVSIMTRLWAGESGVWFPAGARNSPILEVFHTGCRSHVASYSVSTTDSFPVTDVYHSTPYTAEVKNELSLCSPCIPSWHAQGQFYIYHSLKILKNFSLFRDSNGDNTGIYSVVQWYVTHLTLEK